MASPNTLIDSDDEYYFNNSVAIEEEMNRNIVSLNLEQSDEEDNGRTLSPGFEPSYSPQPSTSWEGHDEVPNYSLEPPQSQSESTVDDDVIFVAAYPALGPSRPSEDSDIIQVRGPFYPVQGPFLPPPLQGPAVPLNPEFSRLPDLLKDMIFRYARITSLTPARRALHDEFKHFESIRRELNDYRHNPAAPSRNMPEVPRTPSFFRDSIVTLRRARQRQREQEELVARARRLNRALTQRRNFPLHFDRDSQQWKIVKD